MTFDKGSSKRIMILTDRITNRIRYIFHLLLHDLCGLDIRLTSAYDEYHAWEGPRFVYSRHPVSGELFFAADPLLFERGIHALELKFSAQGGYPSFLQTYQPASALPFDLFAASFFLVSRYEEYLPYMKDEHGRFSVKESISFRHGFLGRPLVNIWAGMLREILMRHFPALACTGTRYRFLPTLDIDAAYAYRQKDLFRTAGGFLNSLLAGDFRGIGERAAVIAGLRKDPFDTYDRVMELQKKYGIRHIIFILFAEYGLNDKNISVHNRRFKGLIKSLSDYAEIGIHPSYGSNSNPGLLKVELERLSAVLNREVTLSRQHFLRVNLPGTYRNLLNLDITDDYSMGFAARPGFRAGICTPFTFYDLDLDTETPLRIHPFTLMDGTLRDYMKIGPDEAMNIIKPLIDQVKSVNGTFISLWHNESLSNRGRWSGWDDVYEQMIEEASS